MRRTENLVDGEAGTAFAMIVNTSLAGPRRVPGFHPEGRYEFKVHLDKEEHENLTRRAASPARRATRSFSKCQKRIRGCALAA